MASVAEVPDEPGQPPALSALSLAEQSQDAQTQAQDTMTKEQIVTPFDVSGGVDEEGKPLAIDYNKITDKFGSQRIDKAMLDRFEKLTGKPPHRLLRRGMVFSHRDLNVILDKYEKGIPFFLYTGRGPSSDSMHVGHTIPFEFTKYLQDAFDVPLIIMLTDDEKFFHSPKLSQEDCRKFALANAMDIIAIGFDMQKTFVFADSEFLYGGDGAAFGYNINEMGKKTTNNQIRGTFGFNGDNNILEFAFPATQSATSFATSFPFIFGSNQKTVAKIPCLIPCAIDQDPYFRQCRDNAPRLKLLKPAIIHSVFLPSLRGSNSKMSASDFDSSIFLSDTDNQIKKKIGKAFSGGRDTKEEQEELGGRTDVDVPFQYLSFFLESDKELESIRERYASGKMQSGEMKATTTKELQAYVAAFRERRKAVTPEVRKEFMRPRQLVFKGMPSKEDQLAASKEKLAASEERTKMLQQLVASLEGDMQKSQASSSS